MSSRRSFLQRAMAISAGALSVPRLIAQSSQSLTDGANGNHRSSTQVRTPDIRDQTFTLDNGVKVFGGDGYKLSDQTELEIEKEIFTLLESAVTAGRSGKFSLPGK